MVDGQADHQLKAGKYFITKVREYMHPAREANSLPQISRVRSILLLFTVPREWRVYVSYTVGLSTLGRYNYIHRQDEGD